MSVIGFCIKNIEFEREKERERENDRDRDRERQREINRETEKDKVVTDRKTERQSLTCFTRLTCLTWLKILLVLIS
jgi:hypothetical protein